MAFIGEIQTVAEKYSAPIGPLPVTGEPMEADLVTSAAVGLVAAVVINPIVGAGAFVTWAMAGPKKRKKSEKAGGH